MRSTLRMAFGALILGLLSTAAPASAQTTLIDFETDSPASKPNNLFSSQSALVSFSDSRGSDLLLSVFTESNDTRGLGVGANDSSTLILDFTTIVHGLSLDFGNDDVFKGDTATLWVYRDGIEVGRTDLVVNGNDLMDQTISLAGIGFNKAVFAYTQAGAPSDNAEIVDRIRFTEGEPDSAVPEPGSLLLFLPAVGLMTAVLRRRTSYAATGII